MGTMGRILVTVVQVLSFLFGLMFVVQAYLLFGRADTILQQVLATLGIVCAVGSFGSFAIVTILLSLHDGLLLDKEQAGKK